MCSWTKHVIATLVYVFEECSKIHYLGASFRNPRTKSTQRVYPITWNALRPSGRNRAGMSRHATMASTGKDDVWDSMRKGAQELVEKEPLLGGFVYSKILNQPTFERSLAFLLATKLASSTVLASQWNDLFIDALTSSAEEETSMGGRGSPAPGTGSIADAARADLRAILSRDPACPSYTHAFLFFKGFQGLQAQRVSHWLWSKGRTVIACFVQSSISEVFGMDLHPGAKFGRGILVDHATGIVVGETAVVHDDCSLFHGVTLGGTGKVSGDRHPKLQKRVVVGAHASVIGNISIGHDSKIGASASILHDLPPKSVVVGHKGIVIQKRGNKGKHSLLSKL